MGHKYKDKYISIKDIYKNIKINIYKHIDYSLYYNIIKRYFEIEDKESVISEFISQLNYKIRGLYFVPININYSNILYMFKDNELKINIKTVNKKPVLNFNGASNLKIQDEKSSLSARYAFADKSTLRYPSKSITMPDKTVSFTLTNDAFESVKKLYTNLSLPDIAFKGEGGKIKLVALDKKNSNSNESSIVVGETDIEFTAYIKAENMKIIPGEYDVALSKAKIAHFKNKKVHVQYWIALEADSSF